MFTRFVAFLASGVVIALLVSRGGMRPLDARVEDALLRIKARSSDPPGASRIQVFLTTPSDAGATFSVKEVVSALRDFGARESAAAVVSLPPLPALSADDAATLRSALFGLGRVIVVLDVGSHSASDSMRLDRIGRGPDLPAAPGIEEVDARVLAGLPALAIADLIADDDGVVRRFAIAHGERDATIPSLPVAIAARALHETSIRLAKDLRTLESFGAADLPLAGPNELRFDLRARRAFAPRALEEEETRNRNRKRPPVRILAFSGSALARTHPTAMGDERIAAELAADAVDDLLSSRTLRSPRPRSAAIAIVLWTPLWVSACSLPRSRRGRVLATIGASLGAIAAIAIATALGVLLPIASFVLALLLGAAIEIGWRVVRQRPTIG